MKSFIILFLLVIMLSSVISFQDVGTQKTTVLEFSIPFKTDDLSRHKIAKICALGALSDADVNYSDENLAIASGEAFLLGKNAKGLNINIQSAIRSTENRTEITIGIPVLSPESR